ncbi:MAG: serpin family protein [Limisphaerales bacterium]
MAGFVGLSAFAASAQNLEKLAEANNGFAFNLLKQIAKEQPTQNIFISPFSVSTALQMLDNGASGKTKSEIQSVLKTENLPPEKLNAAFKELNQSLKSQTNVILDLANGIWYKKGFQLKPDFVAADKEFFQAELAPVDFESPKSANIINDWANKETRGKISGVVSFPFPPLTRVILANAIYFKGKWETAFKKEMTEPRDFYLPNGNSKQTPMMQRDGKFNYQETADFQAVQLPYKGGLRMELFLPKTNSNPQKLVEEFRGKNAWQKIENEFGERDGFVALPKFKMDYEVELNDPLEALGMKQAFDDAANFSGISTMPLNISEVKQKSFVKVDEEGTEAAAVTTITMLGSAIDMNRPKPFEMIVNRPFFFVIADNQTQTILFMGIVNDPKP